MADLIDRQAAIDAVLHHGEIENNYTDLYHDGYCDGVYDSADMLKDLPSVQTEIIRCKDCRFFKGDGLECRHSGMYAYEDDFCSNGERRKDG